MENILKFSILNKLKSVYRICPVNERKESTAEHTWSCLMLADYFISKYNYKLNKEKVYELIMYHDIVEIETGDIPLCPQESYSSIEKQENEMVAAKKLRGVLPYPLNEKFWETFEEYEKRETLESKFAKAIDAYDAIVQSLDYKDIWKGWTKEFLILKKSKYFEPFSEMSEIFYETVDYLIKEGYID